MLGDEVAMKRLEHIVHPLVRQAEERVSREAERTAPRSRCSTFRCSIETAGDKRCDAVVVVTAPSDMQRVRAFERPGMTAEKFDAILAKQTPDTEKRRRADFVVDTSHGYGRRARPGA